MTIDLEKVALNAWVAQLANSADPDALTVWLADRDAKVLEDAAGDLATWIEPGMMLGPVEWLRARAALATLGFEVQDE